MNHSARKVLAGLGVAVMAAAVAGPVAAQSPAASGAAGTVSDRRLRTPAASATAGARRCSAPPRRRVSRPAGQRGPGHQPRHRRGRTAHDIRNLISAAWTPSSSTRRARCAEPRHQGSDRPGHRGHRHRRPSHRADRLQPLQRPGELRLPGRQVAVRAARRRGQGRVHARRSRPPGRHRTRRRLQEGARREPGHHHRQARRRPAGTSRPRSSRSTTSSTPARRSTASGRRASTTSSSRSSRRPACRSCPIVGADNVGFVNQLLDSAGYPGLVGAAVTNPGSVGGAGVTLALQILNGQAPDAKPSS